MALFYKEDLDKFEKRWIMFCEGFLDGNIQFYMFFMAPI